jgi:hypothetical protein
MRTFNWSAETRMMNRTLAAAVMLFLSACDRPDTSEGRGPSGPLVRVLVESAGGVRLNGRPVTLAELADTLRAVGQGSGGVIYAREAPDLKPPPAQDSTIRGVFGLITQFRLPVQLVRPESLSTAGR